ncbi:MAG: ribonuclease HI [Pelagibacteraceae bacterium]|nr:ribonuclease HI [Pelagibacteraceae bacterium]|tara:strand:+ start:3093 stop:3521 length:429 start_codon:yes stop_codon:yes gene_type:complete
MIEIYTDGACSGNPGIGGWGAIIIEDKKNLEIKGGLNDTTNNQMELMATIEALKTFREKKEITIYTDSKYVKDGITTWIKKWKINNWKTANKKDVKNKELWMMLDNQMKKHEIIWKWVKGHEGNYYNEKADALARHYIEKSL